MRVKRNWRKFFVVYFVCIIFMLTSVLSASASSDNGIESTVGYLESKKPENCEPPSEIRFNNAEEMRAAIGEMDVSPSKESAPEQSVFSLRSSTSFSKRIQNTVWSGSVANEFAGGDGTEQNPYQIETAEQLAKLANDVSTLGNSYTNQYFVLTNDIILNENLLERIDRDDISGIKSWTPIGNELYAFQGVFNGYGHTISGLYIERENEDYIGLFGVVDGGVLGNIILEDSYVLGFDHVGGICGYMSFSTIVSCLNAGIVSGNDNLGGICGAVLDSFIYNGYNTGAIIGRNAIAGICGYFEWDDQFNFFTDMYYIEGCINYGQVISQGGWAGGICGTNVSRSSGKCDTEIWYCGNEGDVIVTSSYAGGISGAGYADAYNCYNIGTIYGDLSVGGIYGTGNALYSCFNAGMVTSYRLNVGLVDSLAPSSSLRNCYYLKGTDPKGVSDAGINSEKTAEQFASGEVAYLLNGSVNCGDIWYQTIGEDPYPVLDSYQQAVYYEDGQYKNGHKAQWYPDADGISHYGICMYCEALVENEVHIIGEGYTCTECGYVVPVEKVRSFVERFYLKLLGRAGDPSGIDFWVDELAYGRYTAAHAAASFIFGPEFVGQNNSDEVFLDRLYATFFDRAADPSGKAYWLNYLQGGVTREYVTAQFVNSAEFEVVCAEYGMQRGSIGLSGYVNLNPNLTMYVVRCYREIHGRDADPSGLEFWCEMIATKQRDATHVARSFVDSQEFIEKNLPNEEYLEVLYRAFMGRSSDPSGLAYWLGELERGCTRMEVLDRFADCEEFDLILESFGL